MRHPPVSRRPLTFPAQSLTTQEALPLKVVLAPSS